MSSLLDQDFQYAYVVLETGTEKGAGCLPPQRKPDLWSRPEGHSGGWEEALFCSIRAEEFYVCSEA